MTEGILLDTINTILTALKTPKNKFTFKKVIKGTVPPPDAITAFPSIAFYVAESQYEDYKTYQKVNAEVLFYIFNKHRTSGLSVEDIDSKLMQQVRQAIGELTDKSIISSSIHSSIRDGGAMFPRTIVELTGSIEYIEPKGC